MKPPLLTLSKDFYSPVKPATFSKWTLRYLNQGVLNEIGLQNLNATQLQLHFGQFQPLPGNLPRPLAMRYHGHQFRHFNPQIGDGRGFTFAQFQRPDAWYELGTKGSGQTPYSRSGDGRLTLKGAFREILCTELLRSLGMDTSQTCVVFESHEELDRHDEPSPTRSALLTRYSRGHIRIGTFERALFEQRPDLIKELARYVLVNFYQADASILEKQSDSEIFEKLFSLFVQQATRTLASYMVGGFVHGVLNTDNISLSGESFDYGPYRFLPHYDPQFTAAYFDREGLYAYGRQPETYQWNFSRLHDCLKFADPGFSGTATLENFSNLFNDKVNEYLLRRLNLSRRMNDGSLASTQLVSRFFAALESSGQRAGFEQCFFDFHSLPTQKKPRYLNSPQAAVYQSRDWQEFIDLGLKFSTDDEMLANHSYFRAAKPCTLLIDEIESLWSPIAAQDNWQDFEKKLAEIRSFRGIYKLSLGDRVFWTS